jgi:hypothetical protein
VDFYDAFVSFMDRFGWSPFLGHNAIIRVSALRQVGGLTPGQFADDIDLSVKLRMSGYRARYARFASAGERHPVSYSALLRRTAKWSYGCTQILLRWGAAILWSRRLSLAEKATFALTVSYYHFQALLLLYLCLFYLVLPFAGPWMGGTGSLLVSASLILTLTFLPSITYYLRGGRLRHWPRAAAYWGFTYGSQDFTVVGAIARCVLRCGMDWVPTNASASVRARSRTLLEPIFGLLILAIAIIQHPALLLLPTTVLFVGKFLITPWLNAWFFQLPAPPVGDDGSMPGQVEVTQCASNPMS